MPCRWCDSWIWMCCALCFQYCCILPLLTSCHRLHLYSSSFSLCFLTEAIFSSLPVDAAQGHIIIISKPFARSLPANPIFGLMSHAPHLPSCGAALGPFHKHWPWTAGLHCRPPHRWGWWWGRPPGEAGITKRSNRVDRWEQCGKCEWTQDFDYHLDLRCPEILSLVLKY